MPEDNTIDTLEIEITTSSDTAVKHLNLLANSLKRIDKLASSKGLETLKEKFESLNDIRIDEFMAKLSNMLTPLNQVSSAISRISKSAGKLDFGAATTGSASNVNTAITSSMSDTVEKIADATEHIMNLTTEAVEKRLETLNAATSLNAQLTTPSAVSGSSAGFVEDFSLFDDEDEDGFSTSQIHSICASIVSSYKESATALATARDGLVQALLDKHEMYSDEKVFKSSSNLADSLEDKLDRLQYQAEILSERLSSLSAKDAEEPVDLKTWDALAVQLLTVRLRYQSLTQQIDKNTEAVDSLGNKIQPVRLQFQNLGQDVHNSAQEVKNLKEQIEPTQNRLSKLFERFKNVVIYRLFRQLIVQIKNAAKDGLDSIARFSQESNAILSQYKTEFKYMSNSIGAAITPVLNAALPVVVRLSDLFADLMNSIGMVFAALNGDDTFIKAKKYAQSYGDTLEAVKKTTLGFDELNILGKTDANNDVSKMFEEVDITGMDIVGSLAKITGLIAGITTLLILIKGSAVKEFFTKTLTGTKSVLTKLHDLSSWKKVGASIAIVGAEAVVTYSAFKDWASGTTSLGNALLTTIPTIAAATVAMSAMYGVVGGVISVTVGLASALLGVASAQRELRKQEGMARFFESEGVAIEKVTTLLDNYFDSLGFDKQREMNERLSDAATALGDARYEYELLWNSFKKYESLDSTQIERLATAFNNLANAAIAFNNAAIDATLASLKSGIELNITPELTARLDGLVDSLQAAKDILSVKVQGLDAEYQKILNSIATGDMSIEEAMPRLSELQESMSKYMLSGDISATKYNYDLEEALKKGIAAGLDEAALTAQLTEMDESRGKRLEALEANFLQGKHTLEQLIEIDKTEYGGKLGFDNEDLEAFKTSYYAQQNAVNEKYNQVIDAIYNDLKSRAIDRDAVHNEVYNNLTGSWLRDVMRLKEYDDIIEEQQRILNDILDYKQPLKRLSNGGELGGLSIGSLLQYALEQFQLQVPAHANGGYVEDGLFMANSSELIGKFANGKTAVANNEQIIEGIKRGVSEAMAGTGGQGGTWVIQVLDEGGNVKGETIITAAERKNRRDGKTVISVGV